MFDQIAMHETRERGRPAEPQRAKPQEIPDELCEARRAVLAFSNDQADS